MKSNLLSLANQSGPVVAMAVCECECATVSASASSHFMQSDEMTENSNLNEYVRQDRDWQASSKHSLPGLGFLGFPW